METRGFLRLSEFSEAITRKRTEETRSKTNFARPADAHAFQQVAFMPRRFCPLICMVVLLMDFRQLDLILVRTCGKKISYALEVVVLLIGRIADLEFDINVLVHKKDKFLRRL